MAKEFWVNLPVKEVSKSRAFFKAIGFTENAQFSENPTMASFFLGDKNVVVNFFPEALFKSFSNNEIADTAKGTDSKSMAKLYGTRTFCKLELCLRRLACARSRKRFKNRRKIQNQDGRKRRQYELRF